MIKFAIVTLAVAAISQGYPTNQDYNSEILEAAKNGDINRVQYLLNLQNQMKAANAALLTNVKDLKPVPGGHVYGEAENTYQSASSVNGQTSVQSGGHKIINNDGRVTEYDLKPNSEVSSSSAFDNITPLTVNKTNVNDVPLNLPVSYPVFTNKQVTSSKTSTSGTGPVATEKPVFTQTSSSGQVPVPSTLSTLGQVSESGSYSSAGQQSSASQQTSVPGQIILYGQNGEAGQFTKSDPITISAQSQASGQFSTSVQYPISGQGQIPQQTSISSQIPVSGPGAGAVSYIPISNGQTTYYTSSNSKSEAVHTSGNFQDNPNVSQIKKVIQGMITPDSVKNLRPVTGGQVFGEAQKTYYTWMTVDGKTTVQTHGHKVINENGKITEYDFKPAPTRDLANVQTLIQNNNVSADKIRNLRPVPGGHVYGEAENTYETFSNINGQTFEKAGGHKVVNDDGKVTEYEIRPNRRN